MARKILLADDSVTAQNMGRKILADAGYEVITVNNGSAALKKIAEQKPDLIVLDVYMPGYSGLEVCQRLKESPETARTPVLLTVGKLEPFKPEEAKRVRAEGYIVKPFEASELLSALTKLEDKIVPRSESSKLGRFARANAAIEEGRYDKSVAVEEDSGWKDRISFPSKKKKKREEEDCDDPAIYNAMNKDLRTRVEHAPAHRPQEEKPQEAMSDDRRFDLGALVPQGLPKDVTPEEIAALAAAAAQVQGRIAESQAAEPAVEPPLATQAEAKVEEAKTEEAKIPDQPEAWPETQPQPWLDPSTEVTAEIPVVATFATREPQEQEEEKQKDKDEGRIEEAAEKPGATLDEPASVAAPSPADVIAAIAGLEHSPAMSPDTSSGNGSGSHSAPEPPADEPVTMAAMAETQSAVAASRWTAVPVALAPEEAAISLEQEMQKAHAAFAAAEIAHAEIVHIEIAHADAVATIPEPQPVAAEPAAAVETQSPVEAVAPELLGPLPTTLAPEQAQTPNAESNAATEATSAVAKDFETVAVPFTEAPPPVPVEPEPSAIPAAEPMATQPEPEAPHTVAAPVEENPVAAGAMPEPEVAKSEVTEQEVTPEPAPAKVPEEHKPEEPVVAVAPAVVTEISEMSAEKPEISSPALGSEVSADQAAASPIFSDQVSSDQVASAQAVFDQISSDSVSSDRVSLDTAEAAVPGEPAAGGTTEDMAKKESEIAATTAAAWASWRRIRESGDSKGTPSPAPPSKEDAIAAQEEAPAPQDAAAMAVAAGAESAPEEVPAATQSESEDIASIVDSVLADMRPKIVEEISRKLKKKK